MTTVEALRKARAKYADSPSHCDAREYPAPGTYCPLTAIWNQTGAGTEQSNAVVEALRQVVGVERVDVTLPEWNAEASTEQVLAAFDKAIAREESA